MRPRLRQGESRGGLSLVSRSRAAEILRQFGNSDREQPILTGKIVRMPCPGDRRKSEQINDDSCDLKQAWRLDQGIITENCVLAVLKRK